MIADETEGERTMIAVASVSNAASELAKTFLGQLLTPADAGYEDARQVHNGLIDKRPALIVRCHGVADVVDAIKVAQKLGLEVAVRGGGHNVAGRATIDGGVMIDLAVALDAYFENIKVSHQAIIQLKRVSLGI